MSRHNVSDRDTAGRADGGVLDGRDRLTGRRRRAEERPPVSRASHYAAEMLERRTLLNASVAAPVAPASFDVPPVYAPTGTAQAVATGDFNRDGKPDLVVASAGVPEFQGEEGGGLSILLGRGDGTFAAPVVITDPAYAGDYNSVTAADLNGDGKLDLVTTGDGLQVFLGKGDGTFLPPADVGAPDDPGLVVAADFNGDGRPDLAVVDGITSGIPNGVGIYLNKGNGTFAAPTTLFPGFYGADIRAGDFNGDRKMDLVVAGVEPEDPGLPGQPSTPAGPGLRVLYGNGNGTFRVYTPPGAPQGAGAVEAADFNGDGRTDFAVAVDGGVQLFTGRPGGTFAAGPVSPVFPEALVAADLNHDGRADLVGLNGIDGTVTVSLGRRQGGFAPPATYAGADIGGLSQARALAVGDFNRDGNTDVALAAAQVVLLPGRGDGTLRSAPQYPAGEQPSVTVAGDFNGDGKPDLAVADNGTLGTGTTPAKVGVSFLRGTGAGAFAAPVLLPVPGKDSDGLPSSAVQLLAGNFNGDDYEDLAARASNGDIDVYLGGRNGLGTPTVYAGLGAIAFTAGDFNGDRLTDLAAEVQPGQNGEGATSLQVLTGTATGRLVPGASEPVAGQPAAGDFNGDGKTDLFLNGSGIWLGRGDGTFTPPVPGTGALTFTSSPVVADFNRDGRSDLAGLVPASGNPLLQALLGRPDGTLAAASVQAPSNFDPPAATGDFNGDGLPDLAEADGTVMLGLGDGTFAPPVVVTAPPVTGSFPSSFASVTAADLNGDGRSDLAFVDLNAGSVRVLPGNAPASRPPAAAGGAAPDSTFGTGGTVTTVFSGSRADTALVALALPDGKSLIGGASDDLAPGPSAPVGTAALVRLNRNGTTDVTFGDHGRAVVPGLGPVTSLALQPDGKILVGCAGPAVARFNPDGTLDTTFAAHGTIMLGVAQGPFGGSTSGAAVALAPGGKILVAVANTIFTDGGDPVELLLERLSPGGQPDGAFGPGGVRSTFPGTLDYRPGLADGGPIGFAVQPDGKALIAADGFLARVRPDGTPDPAFGKDGIATAPAGPALASQTLALRTDGRIVIAGAADASGSNADSPFSETDLAVARYKPDGTPDTSFGKGGVATADLGDQDDAVALVLQSDGGVIVGGTAGTGGAALLRFDASGRRDRAFESRRPDPGFPVLALAGRPNGSVGAGGFLAVGEKTTAAARLSDFAVAAYTADGRADPSVGLGGKTTIDFDLPVQSFAQAVAQQPDGKVVAAGVAGPGRRLVLARYNRDGSPDPHFGTGGTVAMDLGGGGNSAVAALVVQPDGKLLVAGTIDTTPGAAGGADTTAFLLARFNPDGTPDRGFGSDGRVVTAFSATESSSVSRLALLPGGKVLAIGTASLLVGGVSVEHFALARYTADGRLDPTFGQGGKVATNFPVGTTSPPFGGHANAAVVLPNGGIVVAGEGDFGLNDSNGVLLLAKYKPNGTLDAAFGSNGRVVFGLPPSPPDPIGNSPVGTAVAVLPDGRLAVASSPSGVVTLNAFHPDGTPDPAYGAPPSAQGLAVGTDREMFPLSGGRLLVVATTRDSGSASAPAVIARFDNRGRPDPTFGTAGRVVADFSAADAALGADGRLLLAGDRNGTFAVARYVVT